MQFFAAKYSGSGAPTAAGQAEPPKMEEPAYTAEVNAPEEDAAEDQKADEAAVEGDPNAVEGEAA